MKKKIALLCCLVLPILAFAQQRIEGLGDLKIGMDRSTVIAALTDKFGKPSELHHYYAFKMDGRFYKMAKPRAKGEFNPYYYDCAVIESYVIPKLVLAALPFRNVVLVFAQDRLVRIEAEGNDRIDNAISAKYGQPHQVIESGKTSCGFDVSGTPKTQETTMITQTWRDDDIHCYSIMSRNYDSDCKPKQTHNFVVESSDADGMINNCELAAPGMEAPLSDSTKARLGEL